MTYLSVFPRGLTYPIYQIALGVAPTYTSFFSHSNLYLFVDYLQPWCKRTFANKSHSLIIASVGVSDLPLKDSLFLDTIFQ